MAMNLCVHTYMYVHVHVHTYYVIECMSWCVCVCVYVWCVCMPISLTCTQLDFSPCYDRLRRDAAHALNRNVDSTCVYYFSSLMQDIIKRTPEDHPDYKNLEQALNTMVYTSL